MGEILGNFENSRIFYKNVQDFWSDLPLKASKQTSKANKQQGKQANNASKQKAHKQQSRQANKPSKANKQATRQASKQARHISNKANKQTSQAKQGKQANKASSKQAIHV